MDVVLIRCDGSAAIGIGHVVRCLTLANALRDRGCSVEFVMRETTSFAEMCLLEADQPWLKLADGVDETTQIKHLIREKSANCVLVDHYGLGAEYLQSLRQAGVLVAVIDDVADRDLSSVDWLLNQNAGAERLRYVLRDDCVRLLGADYCLLRPQFAAARGHREFADNDRNVLVTMGGGDNSSLLRMLLRALENVTLPLNICLVAGSSALTAGNSTRHQIEILHNVANMAEVMTWADLAISAAGSTCWELCCLGVPMLLMVLSPDQDIVAAALTEQRCALCCDTAIWPDQLPIWLEQLLKSPQHRAIFSDNGRDFVDGLGAQRAAQSMHDRLSMATPKRSA